jgi:hypothetical protein
MRKPFQVINAGRGIKVMGLSIIIFKERHTDTHRHKTYIFIDDGNLSIPGVIYDGVQILCV